MNVRPAETHPADGEPLRGSALVLPADGFEDAERPGGGARDWIILIRRSNGVKSLIHISLLFLSSFVGVCFVKRVWRCLLVQVLLEEAFPGMANMVVRGKMWYKLGYASVGGGRKRRAVDGERSRSHNNLSSLNEFSMRCTQRTCA